MALAPRSSLRSLVSLVLHRKPWLSSFSSSSSPTAVPPSGNCTPATPAVQPPSAPALPDSLSHKCPPTHEELPLHQHPDPPKKCKAIIKKSSQFTPKNREHGVPLSCTVDQDPKHPIPDSSTPKPVPYSDNPGLRNSEGVDHPHPDPPKKCNEVIGKSTPEQPVPLLCTVDKDPKHPTSEGGSYSSTPEPVPCSDKLRGKPRDGVVHPIPDPPIRMVNTVLDNPVLLLCTVDEDPKHQTPNGGSYSSTPAPDKAGHENVKHLLPDPPRRP